MTKPKLCFMVISSNHPFHLVSLSPWPIWTSISTTNFMVNITTKMYSNSSTLLLIYSFITLSACILLWMRDINSESTYQGAHTKLVQSGLKLGMIIFIISEILLFSSLFWMLLHVNSLMLTPSGNTWPPQNIIKFNILELPLLNTILLLTSGMSVTTCHYAILKNNYNQSVLNLIATILLGMTFFSIQMMEYYLAPFTITDSTFGSAFFLITGFHGTHVLLGCLMLMATLIRMNNLYISSNQHIGFELAAWYWHFVDVVWLFVIILLYL